MKSRSGRLTGSMWIIFLVATAGWVFDVFESQLFAVFKTPALVELLGYSGQVVGPDSAAARAIDRQGNLGFALFLAGGALGGLGFGILADRLGRIRVLTMTILTYSLFSAFSAFAQNVWQLHGLRFLVALGVGGEWAVAAALVAESTPSWIRPYAAGTFHAASVLGVALAALAGMVLDDPSAWRWGFVLGLLPALLTLVIRMRVWEEEPGLTAQDKRGGSLGELLGDPRWSRRAWMGLALATVGLGTYWGVFAWAPELTREVLGERVAESERQRAASLVYLLMNLTGTLLGLLAFAPLAAWKGRRAAFAVYHVGALITVPLAYFGSRSLTSLLVLLPLMGFFVVGMHAGYAIYFPELFPKRLRATGASFCFNLGRLSGSVVLLLRGELRQFLGLRQAVVAISSLFLVGLILLYFAPETRGKELPE